MASGSKMSVTLAPEPLMASSGTVHACTETHTIKNIFKVNKKEADSLGTLLHSSGCPWTFLFLPNAEITVWATIPCTHSLGEQTEQKNINSPISVEIL